MVAMAAVARRLAHGRRLLNVGAAARHRAWHDVCNEGRLGSATPCTKLWSPLRWYALQLNARPLSCAVAGGALTALVGDAIAQGFEVSFGRDEPELEYPLPDTQEARAKRLLITTVISGIGPAFLGHFWYRSMRITFPGFLYESSVRTILDQIIFAPVMLGLVVAGVACSEVPDIEYIRHRMFSDWLNFVGRMWMIWIFGTHLSYLNVPLHWQPVAALGIGVLWQAHLSDRLHKPWDPKDVRRYLGQFLSDSRG